VAVYAPAPQNIDLMGDIDGVTTRRVLIGLFLLMSLTPPALAENRVALLIGNEAYASEIGRLANPLNDVALLEQTLKGLGFEVVTVRDAGLGSFPSMPMPGV
jgi:hypothetical protein